MKTAVTNIKPETEETLQQEKAKEWAFQAMREGNWPEATQRWAVFRKAYPEHSAGWLQGAKAHIEANELDHAEILLEHGRQFFSSHENSLFFSADLAIKRQQWNAAESFLQRSREKFPNLFQTWMKSSLCSEQQGDIERAIEYNEKARQCAPNTIDPFIQYAEIAMRAQQWEQALTRWELLRKQFPGAPAGYRRAAEAARKLGDNKRARQLLLTLEYGEDLFHDEEHTKRSYFRAKNQGRPGHLFELIWTKAVFNLRSEVQRNYLSYVWWILEPFLHMMVYYVVFGLFMDRGGENYVAFLLAGTVPWMWFSKTISGSSGSILAGQNLMLQVGVPPILFPLIHIQKAGLQQIPVFLLLMAIMWLQGYAPNVGWLAMFPVIFVQLLITSAFTCIVAGVIPFARDLNYLVNTGLMLLMFGSGIFYDYKTLSVAWQHIFLLNPIAFLLKCYREILIDGVMPDFTTLAWWGGGSAVLCLIILQVYAKLRYIYPRIVSE